MHLKRSVVTLLCQVYAVSSVSFYQEQINSLSQNVTSQLFLLRDSQRAMSSSFLRRSLDSIGRHTAVGRIRTAESLEHIRSFDASLCVEQALAEQTLYVKTLESDLSGCAGRAYSSVADGVLEDFRQLIGSVQLAAFLALGQGMVAIEAESTEECREQYLRGELEFFNEVWGLYSDLLDKRLIEYGQQLEESFVDVEKCLGQAIYFYNFAVEYVKANLDRCLSTLRK